MRVHTFGRRTFLGALAGAYPSAAWLSTQPPLARALSKEQRDRLSPGDVIEALKKGNERFRSGRMLARDYRKQQLAAAAGQYPAAAMLGCIDSRGPAEIIFDTGIGDLFNARVAGNVVTDEVLGSLEYSCAVAGAKTVVLFGHTDCGAIKGAIDGVEMGHLTGVLDRIKPAVAATTFNGRRSSKDHAFVDAVARKNVHLGVDAIRQRSSILADLERKGAIQIVGAIYDLATGMVEFGYF
jgi:carbonic anhydrase